MSVRRRSFGWVRLLVFFVLIVAVVIVVILVKNNFRAENKINDEQITTKNELEDNSEEENNDGSVGGDKILEQEKKVPQYDGETPNTSKTLTGIITYADVMGDDLIIRVNIDQFLLTGTCNIIVSRDNVV